MSLSNLAAMGKIEKNTKTKVKPIGVININTRKYTKCATIYESGLIYYNCFSD